MAGLAALGENREGSTFRFMGIVTGAADEGRAFQVAAAGGEQLVLIGVDVQRIRVRIAVRGGRIIVREQMAGPEPEKGMLFGMDPRVTDGADVEPLLAVETIHGGDEAGLFFIRMAGMPGRVLCRRAVTALAVDAGNQRGAVEEIDVMNARGLPGLVFDEGGMAFEAGDGDRAVLMVRGIAFPGNIVLRGVGVCGMEIVVCDVPVAVEAGSGRRESLTAGVRGCFRGVDTAGQEADGGGQHYGEQGEAVAQQFNFELVI